MNTENPYASPSSDSSPDAIVRPGILEVRWVTPAPETFAVFAMAWSLSTGIVVGVVALGCSVFVEAEANLIFWRFERSLAGLIVGMLFATAFCLPLGLSVVLWYPVFRLMASITGGLKLRFRAAGGQELRFSRLCFGSFIKLASLCGLFLGTLLALIGAVFVLCKDPGSYSILGVPASLAVLPDAHAKLLAAPVLYAVYAGLLAVPAFLPFRYVTRGRRRAVILDSEIAPGR